MKPSVEEMLKQSHEKASESGDLTAQSFPAETTDSHIPPNDYFVGEESNDDVVHWHFLNRQTAKKHKKSRGKSAYLDTKVFYSANEIRSGALDGVEMPTCFGNGTQAFRYRQAQCQLRENVVDSTLPQTKEEKRKLVHTLFQAFKSVALSEDNEKFLEAFRREEHDNVFVEIAYWEILERTIERTYLTNSLQNRFWSNNRKFETYEYKNFAERFDSVVHTLARNKTLCKSALEPPRILRMIDDPYAIKSKTDSNRTVNANKAEILRKGRSVQSKSGSRKRGRGTDILPQIPESDDSLLYDTSTAFHPPPAKHARTQDLVTQQDTADPGASDLVADDSCFDDVFPPFPDFRFGDLDFDFDIDFEECTNDLMGNL